MVIGISGKKRSGKNTVGGIAMRWLWDNAIPARQMAIADQLKREVAEVTGMSKKWQEEHKDRWRTILQWWGSEFRRHYFGEDYWLNLLTKELMAMDEDVAVLTDVRFKNEADYVRKTGGFVIRVERGTGLVDVHSSETDLDHYEHFEHVVNNDGSIADLEEQVVGILENNANLPKLNEMPL
tara:strand:- start:9563 stop:10105 length:543 start_codon:yes stop_codon:yes gene_type:complete